MINVDILLETEILAKELELNPLTTEVLLDITEAILFREKFSVTDCAKRNNTTRYHIYKSLTELQEIDLIVDKYTI